MVQPNYWMLPAQGLLLLWPTLHAGFWNTHSSAEPVTTPGASFFSNSSENSTDPAVPLICQSFQCSGERCYQEAAEHGNNTWESCHNASYCELFRLNSTSYTAGCSGECGNASATEMCVTNSSVSMELCIMECCNSPNCLHLNATAYGDLPPTTTLAPTTTPPAATTTITTTGTPKNGKVCGHFTCHGEGCYRGQKFSEGCKAGFDFCEMKKTGSHFVAGCSKVCKTAGPACAKGSPTACYQECCLARPKTSCLKLDGKVHFNRASWPGAKPQVLLLACAATIFGLIYATPLSLGPN